MEGRTGSLGHLAAWGDEAPVKNRVVIISAALMLRVWSVHRKVTYLRGFRLTDSQSFSEISIHSIIGFPFSLRRFDPVGDDLRGKKNNHKNLIWGNLPATEQTVTVGPSHLLLLPVVLSFERVHTGVLCVHGEVSQGALAQ